MNFIKFIHKNIFKKIETEDVKETIVGIIDEKYAQNKKYEIILSKNNDIDYITIISQKRKEKNIPWENTGEMKMTVYRLEKILKKIKKIGNYRKI